MAATAPLLIVSVTPFAIPHSPFICMVSAGNGARFVRLFADVWAAMPSVDRDQLRAFFRRYQPTIELRAVWDDSHRQIGYTGPNEIGSTVIRFCAPRIDRLTDADVRFVIAHELAHCYQWATGILTEDTDPSDELTRIRIETDADQRAEYWTGDHDADLWHATRLLLTITEHVGEQWPAADLLGCGCPATPAASHAGAHALDAIL